ncbi:hypothetical protein XENORESO_011731 [Xenotaenia resolanae]|uniref:Uncharacterized protein n=1 Tax=Xenotaenia resolanae TaxID=208358 RepID=A0ABV0WLF4_9TELE
MVVVESCCGDVVSNLTELDLFCKEMGKNVSLQMCKAGRDVLKVPAFKNHKTFSFTFTVMNSCVGLSHKIPERYADAYGCNVGMQILLQGSFFKHLTFIQVKVRYCYTFLFLHSFLED